MTAARRSPSEILSLAPHARWRAPVRVSRFGSLTSQLFANIELGALEHFIVQQCNSGWTEFHGTAVLECVAGGS